MLESRDTTEAAPRPAGVGTTVDTEAEEVVEKQRLPFGTWIAVGWLVVVVGAAAFAPLLPIEDPFIGDFSDARAGWFERGHVFGADDQGRDVLSRAIWGGRASLLIAVGAIVFGTVIGGFFGLVAGYVRGRTDTVLSATFNIFLAFPQLVLALTLVAVLTPATDEDPPTWGERIWVMILAIGLVSIPILARITRANALAWSQREFVTAARAQGARSVNVMFREVFPNVLPAMLSIALLGVAVVIVIEGSLALFGLSVTRPEPSWGNQIAAEIGTLDRAPHVWQAPAALIFLTVLALNYVGDVLRARFDVRESAL